MKTAVSPSDARKIRYLRKRGYTIGEISKECLHSKSTIARYARGVAILPNYHARWLQRQNAGRMLSERNWEIADQRAASIVDSLSQKKLAIIAAVLYWAEGAKLDFTLSNTDPNLISVFVKILRTVFKVKKSDFKISLRIYEDLDKRACIAFWAKVTGMRLGEHTSVDVLHGNKHGKLKYGMCRVRLKKAGLLLKTFSSILKRITMLVGPRSSTDRTVAS